jgi:hypothetical protein
MLVASGNAMLLALGHWSDGDMDSVPRSACVRSDAQVKPSQAYVAGHMS